MRDLLWKIRARAFGPGLLRNATRGSHPRRALLLHRVAAFRPGRGDRGHQQTGQAREIARALGEFGYGVDVADWSEHRPILDGLYDLVIDLHPAERTLYDGHLAPGAVRLSWITGSNPSFSNAVERERLEELKRRKGVTLVPRRQVAPFPRERFESFDGMLAFAGPAALRTYEEFRLPPVHLLVNNGYDEITPTDPSRRDPRRFLFMASFGQVLKGLDRLLEAFAEEPALSLTVLSMFRREPDFVRAYRRELTRLPNIRAIGFLNVGSKAFREIQAECGWLVLPSGSEGKCGTITVAMSFGLPCVASGECGFEEPEVLRLPDCRIETIRSVIRDLAARPAPDLRRRAEDAAALVRRSYTRADFARSIRAALTAALGGPRPDRAQPPGSRARRP
ncbi:MAG TPA: glycosyltransferase [Candidatus Eisenbacteria bacterium]